MKGGRSLAVLVAVAVACSLLAVALASGAAAEDGATEIDSCTAITEPGQYELTADVQTDEADSCIVVNSSDVTIDGNGHTVEGPWPVKANDTVVAGVYVEGTGRREYENVTLRNVEIDGWKTGIRVGGGYGGSDLAVENAVVRDGGTGIRHYGLTLTLASVTVENNVGAGLDIRQAGVEATDLTLRENNDGIDSEATSATIEDSRVVDNDDDGVFVAHNSNFTLTGVTVAGNGGHGLMTVAPDSHVAVYGSTIRDNAGDGVAGYGQEIHLENTAVVGNGRQGIQAEEVVALTARNVTASENEALEVNGGSIDAEALHVGPSATTAFQEDDIALEPVDREALPPREGGTATGDGLNVSGDVDGPVELELDFDNDGTNDDTADLWRHGGDEWETVEEDLPVTDGTVEATVERNGTYAPGTDDEGDDDLSTIDTCTVIYDPGEYELVTDIQSDEPEDCIEIRADDVTIDGNGHVVEGPGADGDGIGIDVGSDGYNSGLAVRNVEIVGWHRGIDAGGDYELADAVVRDNRIGLDHNQGGAEQLTNVTVENNDVGIDSMMGRASGTDVTIRENGRGIKGEDGGNYYLESSRIVDNDGYGASVLHSSELNLTDSTVSGNGGHGLYLPHYGSSSQAHIENTTVSDNGGDGIRTSGSGFSGHVRLEGVTLENNDGLELNAISNDDEGFTMPVTATDLDVGPSATTAFEAESLRLEPVARGTLPAREDGSAAGDGLNVSGAVGGSVELELDVETGEDTVDLWRYDGSQWETVEEDLPVTDGTVETTVERNGTYAPGTDDEEDSDGSEDESDDTDGSDGSDDDTDRSEDSGDGSDGTRDSDSAKDGDRDGADGNASGDGSTDGGTSDEGGQTDQATATPASDASGSSGSGGSASSGGGASGGTTATTAATATPGPTDAEPSDPGADDDADEAAKEGTETSGSDEGDTGTDATGDSGGDDPVETEDDDISISLADGPGFGPLAALLALAASGLLVRLRR